jgi:uncharacterized protein (DUF1501 family)
MVSKFSEHTSANYFLHTGNGFQGRPSAGAWITYGLGSEAKDLPGFVILNGGLVPPGGLDNFNSGFLPAAFQGSVFRAGDPPVANAKPQENEAEQAAKRSLTRRLDELAKDQFGSADAIEAAIANAETAFRMQAAVPELTDLSRETKETKALYGLDAAYEHTRTFGRQCLLARRLVERGVSYVTLDLSNHSASGTWDTHGDNIPPYGGIWSGLRPLLPVFDHLFTTLVTDLGERGLLDDVLVIAMGEFGRSPQIGTQGSTDGRNHWPYVSSITLAGGGFRHGQVIGSTDRDGGQIASRALTPGDLAATIFHHMGVPVDVTYEDHQRRPRFVVEHGEPIRELV